MLLNSNLGDITFPHWDGDPQFEPYTTYKQLDDALNRGLHDIDVHATHWLISTQVDTNPLTCCCGGQGLIRQVIKGDGMAFIGAMGVITHKTLAPGETLLVDTNSLVSWEDSVEFDVRTTGGCCT